MFVCPKCGHENNDANKFCTKCGTKLEKIQYCPECGTKVEPNSLFCGECGKKLVDDEAVIVKEEAEKPSIKKEKTTSNAKTSLQDTIVFYLPRIISILFMVMLLVAVWGSSVCFKTGDTTTEFNASFWFDKGWAAYKNLEYLGDAANFSKFLFLYGFITFIISLAGTYLFAIVGLFQTVKSCLNKEKATNFATSLSLAAFFGGFHFLTEWFVEASNVFGTKLEMGWGMILYLVFLIILIVSLVLTKYVKDYKNFASNKYSLIKITLMAIFVPLFSFMAFTTISGIDLTDLGKTYFSPTSLYNSALNFNATTVKTLSSIATGLGLAGVFFASMMLAVLIYALVSQTNMSRMLLTGIATTAVLLLIAVFVISLVATGELLISERVPINAAKTIPSDTSIASMVFASIIILSQIGVFASN